jgi:bifunctional DNase/RNase
MSDETPAVEASDTEAASPAPLENDGASVEVPYQVMHFESVLFDLTDPSPMVHLIEAAAPYRFVVIPVALADGIALQHANDGIEAKRPGTHELMTNVLTRLHAEVIAARIVRVEGGIYYAELDLMTPKGREVFDCRASDALSLALRQSVAAPILCSEDVLQAYLG